jgi:hypothetical protein
LILFEFSFRVSCTKAKKASVYNKKGEFYEAKINI